MVDITLGHARKKTVAIVDVGDDSVAVAIAHLSHSGEVEIVATTRSTYSLEKRDELQSIARISSHIKESGEAALRNVALSGEHAVVSTAYVIVHAPWAETESISISKQFASEVEITETTLSQLARESFRGLSTVDTGKIMDAHILSVELNGYATRKPEGKHAHSIDVTSIISDCNTALKAAAQSAVTSLFPVAKVLWRSALRACSTVSQEIHNKNYVLVDIGTDITCIYSVHGQQIVKRTVPEGTRTLLTHISGKRSLEETVSALRMVAHDACSNEACDEILKSMASAEPELAKIIGEVMAELKTVKSLPNLLYVIAHPDIESWMMNFFERIDFSQFTLTTLPFTVNVPSSFASRFVVSTNTDGPILVAAALVNIDSRI